MATLGWRVAIYFIQHIRKKYLNPVLSFTQNWNTTFLLNYLAKISCNQ